MSAISIIRNELTDKQIRDQSERLFDAECNLFQKMCPWIFHDFNSYQRYRDIIPSWVIYKRKTLSKRLTLTKTVGFGRYGSVALVKTKPGYNYHTNQRRNRPEHSLLEPTYNWDSENMVALSNVLAVKMLTFQSIPDLKNYRYGIKCAELEFIFNVPYHPNLVRVFEMFITKTKLADCLHIVMEPMKTTLGKKLHKVKDQPLAMKPQIVKSILRQLLNAIKHIHNHGFVHRDIKPDNILLTPTRQHYQPNHKFQESDFVTLEDKYILKLADYGLSMNVNNDTSRNLLGGSFRYMPPENILSLPHGKPVDIWSVGILAYELITGKGMFEDGKTPGDLLTEMTGKLGAPFRPRTGIYSSPYVEFDPAFGFWAKGEELLQETPNYDMKASYKPFTSEEFTKVYDEFLGTDFGYKGITEILQKCLMWDPEKRATADELLNLPYFKQ